MDQWVILANPNATSTGSTGMDNVQVSGDIGASSSSYGRIHLKLLSGGEEGPSIRPTPSPSLTQLELSSFRPPMPPPLAVSKDASHPGLGALLVWLGPAVWMRSGMESEPLNVLMATATCRVPTNPAMLNK